MSEYADLGFNKFLENRKNENEKLFLKIAYILTQNKALKCFKILLPDELAISIALEQLEQAKKEGHIDTLGNFK